MQGVNRRTMRGEKRRKMRCTGNRREEKKLPGKSMTGTEKWEVRRKEPHTPTATAILSPRRTQFISHYTIPCDFLSALSLLFYSSLFHLLSPPYLTSSRLSLHHSTSLQFYSHHLSQPHISSPHITLNYPHPHISPPHGTTPHHYTPHQSTLQSSRHLTSLLLCSALFANSTILCVSGFEDPSSARLEWSYTVRPSVSIGVSPSY